MCRPVAGMRLADVDGYIPSHLQWCQKCDRLWFRFPGPICPVCLQKAAISHARAIRILRLHMIDDLGDIRHKGPNADMIKNCIRKSHDILYQRLLDMDAQQFLKEVGL